MVQAGSAVFRLAFLTACLGARMKPRFSIRDIAWLTLVVALALVWWMDHRSLANRNRFTVETTRMSDGEPYSAQGQSTAEYRFDSDS